MLSFIRGPTVTRSLNASATLDNKAGYTKGIRSFMIAAAADVADEVLWIVESLVLVKVGLLKENEWERSPHNRRDEDEDDDRC